VSAELIAELAEIIEKRQVTCVFQPIFDFYQEAIIGYEALSRGPEDSFLHRPDALFSCAIAHHRLSELELLCRETAIASFAEQQLAGKLFLNVSPNTLSDPAHPKGQTLQLLRDYGLGAQQVVIELTEQDKVDNTEQLRKAVAHYRQLGFLIAIDDLGAGYSGLKQWSEIQPDIVKIDRYFIDHCDQSPVKKEFLKSITELAKATHTRVVAEGIEREEEFQLLRALELHTVQGYLFERPSAEPSQQFEAQRFQNLGHTHHQHFVEPSLAVGWLAIEQQAICQHTLCREAQRIFDNDKALFSLVVIDQYHQPVGLLYKEQLTEVFASPYGHALYDKKPIASLMDAEPLVVDENEQLDRVSRQITDNDFDIRRYIIVTRGGKYLGVVHLRQILKHMTEEKVRHAQHANPLTMLPGNIAINDAIEHRLRSNCAFSIAYFDLNHFKQFNDLYGYASGDSVIKLLADIIRSHCQAVPCFIGHIGGDDFMVVFDGEDASATCQAVIADFDTQVRRFFSPEHIAAQGYWSCNREGQRQFVPLLALAVGLVTPDTRSCDNSHQVATLATDAKKEAKRHKESHLFCCQRRGPAAPLFRLHSEPLDSLSPLSLHE